MEEAYNRRAKEGIKMNAREKFGLEPDATTSRVKTKWQKWALTYHPDYGGSTEEFTKYLQEYKAALKESLTPVPCSVCKGSGRSTITKGFNTIEVSCPECRKNKNK